ncbi:MAG: hypothetical protein M0Z95_17505 [Actinomycetota bacterium]|nr:hypothetical protein [Actinomycetota bacterium]
MEVEWHPLFRRWFVDLCRATEEVAGDVMALLTALEQSGTALGDPESHPVVTSPSRLRALRRTPPTKETPYATTPPMIRVLYGFVTDSAQLRAVALLGGDKTELGSRWYPPNVAEAERRLVTLSGRRGWSIRKLHIPT